METHHASPVISNDLPPCVVPALQTRLGPRGESVPGAERLGRRARRSLM